MFNLILSLGVWDWMKLVTKHYARIQLFGATIAVARRLPGVQLTQPTGEQRTFADVGELAKWSVANAVDGGKQAV
jgi:hypothetical protein